MHFALYTVSMPGAGRAEVYFIAAMMILILIVCTVAVVFFARTYRKEMREKAERKSQKDVLGGAPLGGQTQQGKPPEGETPNE